MWLSLKIYIQYVARRGWEVLIIIGTVAGIVGILDISQTFDIPTGLWLVLLIAALLIVPFLAFHKILKERDELQTQLNNTDGKGVIVLKPTLSIDIQEIEFGISGDPNYDGFPPINAGKRKARWLRIYLYFEGNVFIETLGLVISGKEPIPAFEWKPRHVDYLSFFSYFQIPDWVKPGEQRTLQVIAFANGKNWGSREEIFNFPVF